MECTQENKYCQKKAVPLSDIREVIPRIRRRPPGIRIKNMYGLKKLIHDASGHPDMYPETLTSNKTIFLSTLGLAPKEICSDKTLAKIDEELSKRRMVEESRIIFTPYTSLRDRNKIINRFYFPKRKQHLRQKTSDSHYKSLCQVKNSGRKKRKNKKRNARITGNKMSRNKKIIPNVPEVIDIASSEDEVEVCQTKTVDYNSQRERNFNCLSQTSAAGIVGHNQICNRSSIKFSKFEKKSRKADKRQERRKFRDCDLSEHRRINECKRQKTKQSACLDTPLSSNSLLEHYTTLLAQSRMATPEEQRQFNRRISGVNISRAQFCQRCQNHKRNSTTFSNEKQCQQKSLEAHTMKKRRFNDNEALSEESRFDKRSASKKTNQNSSLEAFVPSNSSLRRTMVTSAAQQQCNDRRSRMNAQYAEFYHCKWKYITFSNGTALQVAEVTAIPDEEGKADQSNNARHISRYVKCLPPRKVPEVIDIASSED